MPETRKALKNLQEQYVSDMKGIVMAGTSAEWKESNLVQDLVAQKLLKAYTGTTKAGDEYARYFQTDPDALKAFQQRKAGGMNLSQRVWNLSEQYKTELEMALSAAIEPGTSAMELAADIKTYLNEPDKMFRRFRYKDEEGNWQRKWKQKVMGGDGKVHFIDADPKAYHPGRGVYRSSARNAQRLARTEINMAYRAAEQERWKSFDFVVGYEVKITQNGKHVEDICDCLKGKYRKDFKFLGWHPACMCYTIPILKTEDEFFDDDEDVKSVNEVEDVPQGFKNWIEDNEERIERAEKRGTLPYFIRDNKKVVTRILNGVNQEEEDCITKKKNAKQGLEAVPSQKELCEQLKTLLKQEKPYANAKLVRIMASKEFLDKYPLIEVHERDVVVSTPSGNITVNLRHGINELYENLEMATDRMRRHGCQIELCEKFEDGKGADSYNHTLERFEEYKVNEKGTSGSIDRNIRDGAKQADVIVLRIDGEITIDDLSRGIHGRAIRCQSLKEIIIIMNDKEAMYTRKQFRKDGFKIQPDDFK